MRLDAKAQLSPLAQATGQFIHELAEWRWWVTLTFRERVSEEVAMKAFETWGQRLAELMQTHVTTSWAGGPQSGGSLAVFDSPFDAGVDNPMRLILLNLALLSLAINCGATTEPTSPEATSPEPTSPEPTQPSEAITAKDGAKAENRALRLRGDFAGFSFSMTKSEVESKCTELGFSLVPQAKRFPGHEPIDAVICPGGLSESRSKAEFSQIEIWFRDTLPSAMKLVSYDARDFESIRTELTKLYGSPQAQREDGKLTCTQEMHEATDCTLGGKLMQYVAWFEGPPSNVASMVRLSRSHSDTGDYVFLFYTSGWATKYWR